MLQAGTIGDAGGVGHHWTGLQWYLLPQISGLGTAGIGLAT